MYNSLHCRQRPALKLIKVVEDGSAKTFIYEDPDKKDKMGIIARIGTKIQHQFKFITS